MYMYVYVYVCMYMYVYVCIYIYMTTTLMWECRKFEQRTPLTKTTSCRSSDDGDDF